MGAKDASTIMQAKMRAYVVAVTLVVVAVVVPVVVAQDSVKCPLVDDKGDNATLWPNKYNCSTFYLCSQGVPELLECPAGLHYNEVLRVCDFPYRAKCKEEQLPVPTEAATSEDVPPATEKIVITKVVKEVIREADAPAA